MVDLSEVISRGTDSSGRPLKNTRLSWARYDEINSKVAGGLLVIVQSAWRGDAGAAASALTHAWGGCNDLRTWNLTSTVRQAVQWEGRLLAGTMWFRTQAQGFDEHIHDLFYADFKLHPQALAQKDQYFKGYNGLASWGRDDFRRPNPLPLTYKMQEDEFMASEEYNEIIKRLDKLQERVNVGFSNERMRDQDERDRDKERFTEMVTELGKQADQLTLIINQTDDVATATALRKQKERILKRLADHPDVKRQDNPSPEGLEEASK